MIFQTVFMYFIISSACLIYAIGIKDLLESPEYTTGMGTSYVKNIFSTSAAILIVWLLLRFLLIPYGFQILFPFLMLAILILFSILLENAWPSLFKMDTREFILGFFAVYLAISEGTTLAISFIIGITVISAFYLLAILFYSLNRKNESVIVSKHFNTVSLMLLGMACIILALYGWNVSWLSSKFFN